MGTARRRGPPAIPPFESADGDVFEDQFIVGLALDRTNTERLTLIAGEEKFPPSPVVWGLTSHGSLLAWTALHKKAPATNGAYTFMQAPSPLPATKAKAAAPPPRSRPHRLRLPQRRGSALWHRSAGNDSAGRCSRRLQLRSRTGNNSGAGLSSRRLHFRWSCTGNNGTGLQLWRSRTGNGAGRSQSVCGEATVGNPRCRSYSRTTATTEGATTAAASSSGAAPNPKASEDLQNAAEMGDHDALVKALAEGADVNSADAKTLTPLHWAAKCGRPADITSLIEAGAKVDCTNKGGVTPLIYAASEGWDTASLHC